MKKPEWMTQERIDTCIEQLEAKTPGIYLCYDLARTAPEHEDMEACLEYAGISAEGDFKLLIDRNDYDLDETWEYAGDKHDRRIAFLRAITDTIPLAASLPAFRRVYI